MKFPPLETQFVYSHLVQKLNVSNENSWPQTVTYFQGWKGVRGPRIKPVNIQPRGPYCETSEDRSQD